MFGGYGRGHRSRATFMPRVFQLSVARYTRTLPRAGAALPFLVSVHEEGTGLTWQHNVEIGSEDEAFLNAEARLLGRGPASGVTAGDLPARLEALGIRLFDLFFGPARDFMRDANATAWLLDTDETILDLPWEMLANERGLFSLQAPFGRIVRTRAVPRPTRDPLDEDVTVNALVIADPTGDLHAARAEAEALQALTGRSDPVFEVDVLAQATRARFAEAVASKSYDILHFAGHASFDPREPGHSALSFADGPLLADEIGLIPWEKPPYLVFHSACSSAAASRGRRLVGEKNQHNGLAAALLSAGVAASVGYRWPVPDLAAARFANAFYRSLFRHQNIGLGLRAARAAEDEATEAEDLWPQMGAVLYGDAASAHRRDLTVAARPPGRGGPRPEPDSD